MFQGVCKAEYLFQPRVLLRRLARRNGPAGRREVQLPWGRRITVNTRDNIGSVVNGLGVYDLIVTEVIWRLTQPGETCIDIGANVGCMSAVFAERVGAAGRVISFEPHPILFNELAENLRSLAEQGIRCNFEPRQLALGDACGVLPLHIPPDFESHRGESTLAGMRHVESSPHTIDVEVERLDEIIGDASVGVMKMDVEGFERNVLLGATELFKGRRVRDCIFEEHRNYPTEVTKLLEDWGYRLFRLDRGVIRPNLRAANTSVRKSSWEATSFLATIDPERAVRVMRGFGWQCLRRGRG